MKIPSNIPYFGPEEEKALNQAMKAGQIIGNGPISKRVQKQMEDMFIIVKYTAKNLLLFIVIFLRLVRRFMRNLMMYYL